MISEFSSRPKSKSTRKHYLPKPTVVHDIIKRQSIFEEKPEGKKHFHSMPSSETKRMPKMKLLAPPSGFLQADPPQGVKSIPQPLLNQKQKIKQLIRFPQQYTTMKDEIMIEKILGKKKKAHAESGINRSNPSGQELNLEKALGGKRKGYTDDIKRNHIPIAKPGDLYYAEVERSDNYFRGEGNIPGSTITARKPKCLIEAIESGNYKEKITFETLQRVKQLIDEMDSVKMLTETKNGEQSWEERTGMKSGAKMAKKED